MCALQAVLGEHERLGRRRYVQCLQKRAEIPSGRSLKSQLLLPCSDALVQLADRVVCDHGGVLDCRMIAGQHAGSLSPHEHTSNNGSQYQKYTGEARSHPNLQLINAKLWGSVVEAAALVFQQFRS